MGNCYFQEMSEGEPISASKSGNIHYLKSPRGDQLSKKENQKEPKEITLPSRKDYQPSKAEMEKEFDMPEADMETVRKAFFQPVKVVEES